MNLYQYCLNNPVNWIDPLGLGPNNLEATNKEGLKNALKRYTSEHPDWSNQKLIDNLAREMTDLNSQHPYSLYGVRYFDTMDGTTIDLLHFAAISDYGQWYFGGEVVGNTLGWINESLQAIKFDSK